MDIKLKEMDFGDRYRYLFLNSGDYPLSRSDFGTLKNGGFLTYNAPFSDEYGDEQWLIMGELGNYCHEYFFAKGSIEKLQELGYTVECYTLADQEEQKQREKIERSKISARNNQFTRIFQFITDNGFYPKHQCNPQGEDIEDPTYPHNIYGGGRWITLDEDDGKIWAIKNNGSDGDYWGANNVATGGAGAIGYYIPYNDDIANAIKSTLIELSDIESPNQFDFTPTLTEEEKETIKELNRMQKEEEKRKRLEEIEEISKTLISDPSYHTINTILALQELDEYTKEFVEKNFYKGYLEYDLYEYNKEKLDDPSIQQRLIQKYKEDVITEYQRELDEAESEWSVRFYSGMWVNDNKSFYTKLGIADQIEEMWNDWQSVLEEKKRIEEEKIERRRQLELEERRRELEEKKVIFKQKVQDLMTNTKNQLLDTYSNLLDRGIIYKSWSKSQIAEKVVNKELRTRF